MPTISELLNPQEEDNVQQGAVPQRSSVADLLRVQQPVGGMRKQPEQNTGFLGDIVTGLEKGALELPGLAAGIADIPFALLTGTRPITEGTQKVGEITGFQPGRWAEDLSAEYSPGLQQAQQEVAQAWEDPTKSGVDVAKAYLKNPAYIANLIAESTPSMLAGGLIGRGLMGIGRAAEGVGALESAIARRAVTAGAPLEAGAARATAAAIAGGAGEGIIQAGQSMESLKGIEDQGKAAIASIGSGLIDAVIGAGAGKIAQKLGFETFETAMAKGFNQTIRRELSEGAKETIVKGGKRVFGGALSEGLLQEFPQSVQETLFQNYAEDKPLWEGVPRSAVEGALTGFAMGAGANILAPSAVRPQEKEIPPSKFEALPDDPTDPESLIYSARGEELRFRPGKDQTREELLSGIEGKSPAAAIGWLKKNAEQHIKPPEYSIIEDLIPRINQSWTELAEGRKDLPIKISDFTKANPDLSRNDIKSVLNYLSENNKIDLSKSSFKMDKPLKLIQSTPEELDKVIPKINQSWTELSEGRRDIPIKITDFEKAHPDLSKVEIDTVLTDLDRKGNIALAPVEETTRTEADSQSAINIRGEDKHVFYMDKPISTAQEIIPAVAERTAEEISTDLGKPDQIEALRAMGITEENDQISQIVRDAVTQKVDIAKAFQARGNTALANDYFAQARDARDTLIKSGNAFAIEETNKAMEGIPEVGIPQNVAVAETTPEGEILDTGAKASKGNLMAAVYSPARQTAKTYGLTKDQVIEEAKTFLGENGYNKLINNGKIAVVNNNQDLFDMGIKSPYPKDARIAMGYLPKQKQIAILSDNIRPGTTAKFLRHEIAHALFREDKKFMQDKKKILDDFGLLAGTDESVREAFAIVPKGTPQNLILEEALAYWLQRNADKKPPLWKRIVATVKRALAKIGIPTTRLSTTDIIDLFAKGTSTWAQQEVTSDIQADPQAVFALADGVLEGGKQKLDTAIDALKNPRSKLHNLYIDYAPQWLSVTPLHTLVQTFGKSIPQLKSFSDHLDKIVFTKTDLVDTAKVKYDKAEKIAQDTVGVDVLNRAAAAATYYKMYPWDTIWNQPQWVPTSGTKSDRLKKAGKKWVKAGMQKATGKSFIEAYNEAKDGYTALDSKELKRSFVDIIDHISSIRKREKNNLLAYIEKVSEEGSDLRKNLMDQFHASFKEFPGVYWPLERIGDFILEYVDANGVRVVEHATSSSEREKLKKDAIAAGVDPQTFKEDYKDKRPRGEIAMPRMLFNQLSTAVEDKFTEGIDPDDDTSMSQAKARAQSVVDDMNQIWLRWQPETSALKNSLERKSVKGFSTDMLRSYLSYVQRHAANIAWTEQGRLIEEDMSGLAEDIKDKKDKGKNVTMDRHILNDLRSRINALRSVNVGPVASFLGKLSTGYYMTSPSIGLVQMSQLGVLTLPKLATMYSPAKATKRLSEGVMKAFSKNYARDAMFADPKVNNVYDNMRATVTEENRSSPLARNKNIGDKLYSDAQILAQISRLSDYQKQLLTMREAMARNLLDITAAHEAYELTMGKDPKSLGSKIFNLAMLPMSLSELASRKAAILATRELAKEDGKNFFETMDDIASVVNDTLYSYAKEGKGAALQGGVSRVILQFMHYRMMTAIRLALLFRNAIKGETPEIKRQATKEFVGVMGMTGALAGSLGLPFSQAMFGVLNLILGDEDEPEDYQLMYENWLQENFGELAGDVAARGLPAAVGVDLSRRIGLADIYGMQIDPPTGLHGRNLAAWWAASQLGPIFSVGQSWVQGYDEIVNKGRYLKGLETATPKPIRDLLKSYRIATEGLKTSQGKRLLSDEAIGPDEVVMTALGFNPSEISKAYSAEGSLKGLSTKISERRGKLIRQAADVILQKGDREEALAAVRSFNKSMPRFAITGGDIRAAIRKTLKGELGVTGKRETSIAQQYEVPVYSR